MWTAVWRCLCVGGEEREEDHFQQPELMGWLGCVTRIEGWGALGRCDLVLLLPRAAAAACHSRRICGLPGDC